MTWQPSRANFIQIRERVNPTPMPVRPFDLDRVVADHFSGQHFQRLGEIAGEDVEGAFLFRLLEQVVRVAAAADGFAEGAGTHGAQVGK